MGKQYKIREDSPQGASQKWRDSFMGASVLWTLIQFNNSQTALTKATSVSYTHLTLPTNREV